MDFLRHLKRPVKIVQFHSKDQELLNLFQHTHLLFHQLYLMVCNMIRSEIFALQVKVIDIETPECLAVSECHNQAKKKSPLLFFLPLFLKAMILFLSQFAYSQKINLFFELYLEYLFPAKFFLF